MTAIAACTDKGAKRKVNQDACCVQCASTPFEDITLAVLCDGVGCMTEDQTLQSKKLKSGEITPQEATSSG